MTTASIANPGSSQFQVVDVLSQAGSGAPARCARALDRCGKPQTHRISRGSLSVAIARVMRCALLTTSYVPDSPRRDEVQTVIDKVQTVIDGVSDVIDEVGEAIAGIGGVIRPLGGAQCRDTPPSLPAAMAH